ncbi:hypothetical protein FA15DRAFT_756650 [Coprinopsis marcescibilis]|uniref:C2H2-type domain-containing protein n=1 Tax=Coprinopsis marcescibilis TaxID=230819 RepID=A0A5C3KUG9_COPMA|nr:hypothetical protein FA15DRAFT_756650 [Coprinopsis marcescibilis]
MTTFYYCIHCERSFASENSLRQHVRGSPRHNHCDDCNRDFADPTGLKDHWAHNSAHHYCQICDEHFDDDDELEDHHDSEHIHYRDCNQFFQSEDGLHEHRRQSPRHAYLYCSPCRRMFQSEHALRNHMRSSAHQRKSVVCPGNSCGSMFVSTSALVLHLESGVCPSGATRSAVNRFVRQHDRNHVITDPSRLITGRGRHTGCGIDEEVTWYATRAAWNGDAYECYLCHATFSSLRALNQHLGSPRHQRKIYICRWEGCQQRFSALSAFCQHVESEKCGVMRFNAQARRIVGGMLLGVRTIN